MTRPLQPGIQVISERTTQQNTGPGQSGTKKLSREIAKRGAEHQVRGQVGQIQVQGQRRYGPPPLTGQHGRGIDPSTGQPVDTKTLMALPIGEHQQQRDISNHTGDAAGLLWRRRLCLNRLAGLAQIGKELFVRPARDRARHQQRVPGFGGYFALYIHRL